MARKPTQLALIKSIVLTGIVFMIASSALIHYAPQLKVDCLQIHLLMTCFFILSVLYKYRRLCSKTGSDLNVLSRFLNTDHKEFEIDLRKLSLREFEDLSVALNFYSEKRTLHVDSLSRMNDTLSININKSTNALSEVNEQLREEIHKHKEMEKDLERALKTAEHANTAKSEFLSNMRHEIRTPMNAIIGMTDLVLDSGISDKQAELLTVVRESGESLLKIINEILDLAKLDSGEVELSHEMFVLADTIEITVRNFEDAAARKGLDIITHIADNVPGMVSGDYIRLTNVLSSIVDNAIKFTDEGHIDISVTNETVEDDKDGEVILHFNVRDTGIGIDQDKRDSIFLPFNQIDGSYTRQFEGTGLGLTIAARTVEKMGGIMWIDDDDPKGSSFNFIVRLEKAVIPGIDTE